MIHILVTVNKHKVKSAKNITLFSVFFFSVKFFNSINPSTDRLYILCKILLSFRADFSNRGSSYGFY